MRSKPKKPIGEWAMFKRRMFAGFTCLLASLAIMVWALVGQQPLWFMPAFMLIMAAWIIIQVAADSGSFSANDKVRVWADKVKR